jgi:hypothetical protein
MGEKDKSDVMVQKDAIFEFAMRISDAISTLEKNLAMVLIPKMPPPGVMLGGGGRKEPVNVKTSAPLVDQLSAIRSSLENSFDAIIDIQKQLAV